MSTGDGCPNQQSECYLYTIFIESVQSESSSIKCPTKVLALSVTFQCLVLCVYLQQQNILTYLHCGACFACSESATSAGVQCFRNIPQ